MRVDLRLWDRSPDENDGGGELKPEWVDLELWDDWVMVCEEVVDGVLVGPGGGLGMALDIRRPDEATTIRGLLAWSSSSSCE